MHLLVWFTRSEQQGKRRWLGGAVFGLLAPGTLLEESGDVIFHRRTPPGGGDCLLSEFHGAVA